VLEILKGKRGVMKDVDVERVTSTPSPARRAGGDEEAARHRHGAGRAYLARRALDYLVGFNLSPVLWRKLPGARSAGRVQSVALRLVVQRELEIEAFRLRSTGRWRRRLVRLRPLQARLNKHEGKRLAKFDLPDEASAMAARAAVQAGRFTLTSVEKKPGRRTPPPPFTTSTLQQEASRKLGFDAKRTMAAAQRLYEGVDLGGETVGLITYMRTDGCRPRPRRWMTRAR
jgi:DNA topoisomerase-1